MALKIYDNIVQGTDEWYAARCGLLTASTMSTILTAKTLKFAENETCRSFIRDLAAQRITKFVEPSYVSADMQRGHDDEFFARAAYSEHHGSVEQVGFMTEDKWGFDIGYSPDGLIGDKGLLEIKSRRQKHQLDMILTEEVPFEHRIQAQVGLLVSGREWLDYVSYCGGMPLHVLRFLPSPVIQEAIVEAASTFENRIREVIENYQSQIGFMKPLITTQRRSTEII